MRITDSTITAAFDAHRRHYALGGAEWDVPGHCDCWRWADQAFNHGDFPTFDKLYERLRRHWQVFRRASGSHWTSREAFDQLSALAPAVKAIALSGLNDTTLAAVWENLDRVKGIKATKSGPSVVAISKFMHFVNPALFVIVDDAVVWRWVLKHKWLQVRLHAGVRRAARILDQRVPAHLPDTCDLVSYAGTLYWLGEVVRDNPRITSAFAEYVRQECPEGAAGLPLEDYEAAAVEWFLLGVVDLPPPGIDATPKA